MIKLPRLDKKVLVPVVILVVILLIFIVRGSGKAPDSNTSQTSSGDQTDSSQEVQPAGFDKNKYSISDPASSWVVVNKERPLNPKDYAPKDLTNVGNSQQLRKEAADALIGLMTGARIEKLTINPMSGYRSYSRQRAIYQNEVNKYGQTVADTQSAKPGYSEHQTGWAIDVGGGGCGIEDCFGNTKEGQWLAAYAYKYGFIIRYPEGKQGVTGYRYEPWHIRYVGVELATEMKTQNIQTLEEFFDM